MPSYSNLSSFFEEIVISKPLDVEFTFLSIQPLSNFHREMFFPLSLLVRGETYGECEGKNTYKDKRGICHCRESYPYGDPESKEGCFFCYPPCRENSVCVYPGRCECAPGYTREDSDLCHLPTPVMLSMTPRKVLTHTATPVTINYNLPINTTVLEVFCRFGDEIVIGNNIDVGVVNCTYPKDEGGVSKVAISLDKVHWSYEIFFLEYTKIEDNPVVVIVWQVWILLALIIVGVLGGAFLLFFKKEKGNVDPSEITIFKPLSDLVDIE